MKSKRKFLQIFTLCFCLVCFSTGCGNNDTNTNSGTQKPLDSTNQTGTMNNDTGNNTGVSSTDSERRVLADRICRAIENIDGVQDATVLIADASTGTSTTSNNTNTTAGNNNTTGSTAGPSNMSNATDTSGTGTTSSTSGTINNTNGGSNTGTNNTNTGKTGSISNNTTNNEGDNGNGASANGTAVNAAPGNGDAPYVAIVGVTATDSIQADTEKQNSLAQTIRQLVMQDENSIQDVVVTMDENDIQNIGNLANNMMQNASTDATDEINRLRDDLMNAGTNLTRSARDITDGVANGVKDLVR